jgi:hypothetical protein
LAVGDGFGPGEGGAADDRGALRAAGAEAIDRPEGPASDAAPEWYTPVSIERAVYPFGRTPSLREDLMDLVRRVREPLQSRRILPADCVPHLASPALAAGGGAVVYFRLPPLVFTATAVPEPTPGDPDLDGEPWRLAVAIAVETDALGD